SIKGWLVVASIRLGFALRRRVETVGDQVKKRPRDLLREKINLASSRVKGSFEGDIEALLLRPRSVIGEIEALIDQGVNIDRSVLSRALTRMQQHVLDDRVGALTMLHDLVEIALERIRNLTDLRAQFGVKVRTAKRLPQFVDKFDGDGREIVHEVERVLDLVGD